MEFGPDEASAWALVLLRALPGCLAPLLTGETTRARPRRVFSGFLSIADRDLFFQGRLTSGWLALCASSPCSVAVELVQKEQPTDGAWLGAWLSFVANAAQLGGLIWPTPAYLRTFPQVFQRATASTLGSGTLTIENQKKE